MLREEYFPIIICGSIRGFEIQVSSQSILFYVGGYKSKSSHLGLHVKEKIPGLGRFLLYKVCDEVI